jgi:serine/threonine protein kinase
MPAPVALAPGTLLCGHRILSRLTSGGMGSVYVAEHVQTGRRRAIKLMHPGLVSNEKLRHRFEQEAKVGALIESDHVVEVQDAGVDPETGMPWLAMELLKGEELGHVIKRRGALPPAEVREIFKQLCHALAAAHDQGIVHRDLKPENLFLATARRPDVPFTLKVLDFGIAKIMAEATTATTDMIGSPLWMAPEQARYDQAIHPATDVWALGLIAYRLLTGEVYWYTPHSANPSPMALLHEVGIGPLASASARAAARGVAGRLPSGFDAWFGRCVNRAMAERFPSAREAWAALDPILAQAAGARLQETVPDLAPPTPQSTEPGVTVPEAIAAAEPAATIPGASTTSAPTVKRERTSSAPGDGRSPAVLVGGALAAFATGGVLFFVLLGGKHQPPKPVTTATAAASTPAPPVVPPPAASSAPAPEPAPEPAPRDRIAFDASSFIMGNDARDTPAHRVSVPAFALDRTEVTVAAYRACVDAGQCTAPRADDPQCNWRAQGREDHPVDCVDQAQAAAFCASKGMRLPTEQEWEYAARGRDGRPFPWKGEGATPARACYDQPSGTCPVGSHPEGDTPEGVADMAGNVWEWTKSPFCPYAMPLCGNKTWVLRGGSASSKAELIAATVRLDAAGADHVPGYGFRCAADAPRPDLPAPRVTPRATATHAAPPVVAPPGPYPAPPPQPAQPGSQDWGDERK